MPILNVVNIKCGGCEKGIEEALAKAGMGDIKVSAADQIVSFEGDADTARKILTKMGYPEAGSEEAKSFLKKAKSYMSCMIGKTKNKR